MKLGKTCKFLMKNQMKKHENCCVFVGLIIITGHAIACDII